MTRTITAAAVVAAVVVGIAPAGADDDNNGDDKSKMMKKYQCDDDDDDDFDNYNDDDNNKSREFLTCHVNRIESLLSAITSVKVGCSVGAGTKIALIVSEKVLTYIVRILQILSASDVLK